MENLEILNKTLEEKKLHCSYLCSKSQSVSQRITMHVSLWRCGEQTGAKYKSHTVYQLKLCQFPLETKINHHNSSALYHTHGIASFYFYHTNEQFPLADFMMVTPIQLG